MPFFSIVIPVYNRANFITATVNSVLKQSFDDFELVIVDDGSTDGTGEVIRGSFINNAKVKYIWQENMERGAARNNGFKVATGRYVVFLDSDDLMQPEYLSVLHAKIIEQDFPNFLTAKYLLKRNGKDSASGLLKSLREGYCDLNLQLRGAVFACNIVVRRENPELNLFVEDRKYATMEDWMFVSQNLEHDRIYLLDKYMIIMNDHDDRSMRGNNKEIIKKHILATDWIDKNIVLTANQKKELWGYAYYFCAIHSYIDGSRKATFQYLVKSISRVGIDSMKMALLVKGMIGYKVIQRIR